MIERISCRARGAALTAQIGAQIVGQTVGQFAAIARRIMREAGAELARLNRAGLSAEALAGKPRSARARLVTAALAHRHDGHHRCC